MKRPHFALPEIYDDSLSYYDVLRKLIKSMHVISDNLNKIPEQIANEAKAREQADGTLQTNIDNEKQSREQADTTLQQNINSEATTREQADQEIREGVSNKISELKGDLYESIVDITEDNGLVRFPNIKEFGNYILDDSGNIVVSVSRSSFVIELNNNSNATIITTSAGYYGSFATYPKVGDTCNEQTRTLFNAGKNVLTPLNNAKYLFISIASVATAELIVDGTHLKLSEVAELVEEKTEPINEDQKFDFVIGGFDTNSMTFNTSESYYHSNFILIRNNVLKVLHGYSITPLRFVVYSNDGKNIIDYSESVIDQEKVNNYNYASLVVYTSRKDNLIIVADDTRGILTKKVDVAYNYAEKINNYRYIATTFGSGGRYGMYLLASNDLRNFDLISEEKHFMPSINEGIRDPSIIFINGWYWIVYTIADSIKVTNQIGLCRTKNFVDFEEFPNLTIIPSNGDDLSNGYCWAPAFFRDVDNRVYIICACCTDTSTQNFYHRIIPFNSTNGSVDEAYTTNVTNIDCHAYYQNGTYYMLGSQGALWKSYTLLSNSWEFIQESSLRKVSYEGQFAIRKDDGKLRVFGQNVPNSSIGQTDQMMYYQDGGNTLESDFTDKKPIVLSESAKQYATEHWDTSTGYYWHLTIYDRNCWMDNNNNYQ